ncbi:hypothetical protein LL252_03080 [Alcanivorax marinus]|uniref:Uncharacterized protein n=1 Tax=Alloalcanivorax marinus TaxID=1177169 RepID=A0A9Q3YN58_9GAMM|nr:hypothetical protein [Alloalcanivorax marinus]MCC4307545.1 hypothetical protein [Alloalcanivorax marinus]
MSFKKSTWIIGPALLGITLVVAGCGGGSSHAPGEPAGGDGGSPGPSAATLSGTAAIGAAIRTGTVTAACSDGSGFTETVTTNANGSWSGQVAGTALPCVLTVTGGTPPVTLRSYASQAGTVNVTPITDMVLALATGSADGGWVANPANWPDTATVATRKTELLSAMSDAGFALPGGDPFTRPLVIGDDWDQVLDALQDAIDDDPDTADYDALLARVKDGQLATFPAAPDGGPSDPEPPEPGAELLNQRNGVAVVRDGHLWAMEQPFIETFGATTAKRQIRANNFGADNVIQDTTPFAGEELVWAQINVAHGTLGTQLCDGTTGVVLMTVDSSATPAVYKTWTATDCELDVDYHFGNGATEGRLISATLSNDRDADTVTLSDGQFRLFIHTGKEGPMPELSGDVREILMVDSGTREIRSGYFERGKPLEDGSHPDHYIDFGVSPGSANPAVGSYPCGSSSVSVSLSMGWVTTGGPLFKFQTSNGGACTVTVEQSAGRKYVGSYTATLIGPGFDAFGSGLTPGDTELPEAERTLQVHGLFRNFTTQTFHADNQGNEGPLGGETRGVTLTIDDGNTHFEAGETFLLASEESSNGHNGYFYRRFSELRSPDDQLRMVWSGIPMAVGSYACNDDVGGLKPTMSLSTPANVPYGVTYTQSGLQQLTEGASCSLNVTSVDDGLVTGTYIATLVARNIAPVLPGEDASITVSGEFRYPNTGL